MAVEETTVSTKTPKTVQSGKDRAWLESLSARRVMQAIAFECPDRLPCWDNFNIEESYGKEFVRRWRAWKGVSEDVLPIDYYGIDIAMCIPDESPFRSRAGVVETRGEERIIRTGWGTLAKVKQGGYFFEPIECALEDPGVLDRLVFESPDDETRYDTYEQNVLRHRAAGRVAFCKVGGVYCRSQFLRREDRLLMDMVMEPPFVEALFSRVGEHLTRIALRALQRSDSWPTGLWVFDDCANSRAPMFSPAMWEQYLLPVYQRMIRTLKAAGCRYVFFHSDGNIGPLIDLLLEAGFDGFNPLEPRCGLDLPALRERLGRRGVFFGGACNTQILPGGDPAAIEQMVKPLAELGRSGGLIIGSASIGDDISPRAYDYYMDLVNRYATYR